MAPNLVNWFSFFREIEYRAHFGSNLWSIRFTSYFVYLIWSLYIVIVKDLNFEGVNGPAIFSSYKTDLFMTKHRADKREWTFPCHLLLFVCQQEFLLLILYCLQVAQRQSATWWSLYVYIRRFSVKLWNVRSLSNFPLSILHIAWLRHNKSTNRRFSTENVMPKYLSVWETVDESWILLRCAFH